MRIVVQRVMNAQVEVAGEVVGKIPNGLVLLVGFTRGDDLDKIKYLKEKVLHLRIFDDENGKMNLSIQDIKGEILSISQFTLYGNTKKGTRPSFIEALNGEAAEPLYDLWNEELKKEIPVATGIFGADMKVSLTNDGPVTILLER